jgi:hypothetical protein
MASPAAPAPLPASRYNHGEAYAALRSGLAGVHPDLHLFPPRCRGLPGADVLAFIDIGCTQKRACGHKKQGGRQQAAGG